MRGTPRAFLFRMNQEGARLCMYILRALLVGSLCLCDVTFAQQQNVVSVETRPSEPPSQQSAARTGLPAAVPANRPLIGVALEGGGALGLAHIGVLEWFEENHIPVDRIAGTSMGSMVGAMYASGQSIAAVKKLVTRNEFNDMFALRPAYS